MVPLKRVGARHLIGVQPGIAGTVGAGHHEPMQHGGEHRALLRCAPRRCGCQAGTGTSTEPESCPGFARRDISNGENFVSF